MKIVLLEPLGIPEEVLARYQVRLEEEGPSRFPLTGRGPQTRLSFSAAPGSASSFLPTPPILRRWWRRRHPVKAVGCGVYRG